MENLIQLGITEIEAKILDIILKHEKISGGNIISLTGLHRNVIYDSLKRLMEKSDCKIIDSGWSWSKNALFYFIIKKELNKKKIQQNIRSI